MQTQGAIRKFNPADGQAFQGDVSIIPVPTGLKIERTDEIRSTRGRLILQHGEVTGHHHGIDMLRVPGRVAPVSFRPNEMGQAVSGKVSDDPELQKIVDGAPVITARLYRDPAAADQMVRVGVLTRADLVVGFLVIEGGPAVVTHQEHDGIELPAGEYCIGRQVESAGAEERAVAD